MIKCKSCGAEISAEATACPKCGHPGQKQQSNLAVQAVFGVLLACGAAWYFFGGGLDKEVAVESTKIDSQVINDAISQYNIAKRQGDKIQICVEAGSVSAAELQAKDEDGYQRWKQIEENECGTAGISSGQASDPSAEGSAP